MALNQNLGDDMGTHCESARQRNNADGNPNDEAEPLEVAEIISVLSNPDRGTHCRNRDGRHHGRIGLMVYPNRLVPNPIVLLIFDQHARGVHAARGAEHAPCVAQMLDDGVRRQPELAGDLLGFEIAVDQAQALALPLIQTGERHIIHFGAIYPCSGRKSPEPNDIDRANIVCGDMYNCFFGRLFTTHTAFAINTARTILLA